MEPIEIKSRNQNSLACSLAHYSLLISSFSHHSQLATTIIIHQIFLLPPPPAAAADLVISCKTELPRIESSEHYDSARLSWKSFVAQFLEINNNNKHHTKYLTECKKENFSSQNFKKESSARKKREEYDYNLIFIFYSLQLAFLGFARIMLAKWIEPNEPASRLCEQWPTAATARARSR